MAIDQLRNLLIIALGVVVGAPAIVYGVQRNFEAGWSFEYSQFFGSQYNYWASLLVSGMWVGLVMLVCKAGLMPWLRRALSAVGRTAFTNYIGQTVICTLIFYGHGLGLYGSVSRVEQALIVLGVWAVQLAISTVWMWYFRFGPLEWAWRCLTYWRLQPMRRMVPRPEPATG